MRQFFLFKYREQDAPTHLFCWFSSQGTWGWTFLAASTAMEESVSGKYHLCSLPRWSKPNISQPTVQMWRCHGGQQNKPTNPPTNKRTKTQPTKPHTAEKIYPTLHIKLQEADSGMERWGVGMVVFWEKSIYHSTYFVGKQAMFGLVQTFHCKIFNKENLDLMKQNFPLFLQSIYYEVWVEFKSRIK